MLFGQFHDILPGSGVRATREYQSGLFQQSAAAFSMVQTSSLARRRRRRSTPRSPSARVAKPLAAEPWDRSMGAGAGRDTAIGGLSSASHQLDGPRAIVIFNPTAQARSQMARATIWDPGNPKSLEEMRKKTYVVHTADGSDPSRLNRSRPARTGATTTSRTSCSRSSVGPMGYASFVIEEAPFAGTHPGQVRVNGKPAPTSTNWRNAAELTMENESILARFDKTTGGVASLVDKKSGIDFAPPGQPMGVVEYLVERPRDMSAWSMADAKTRLFPVPGQRAAA